MHWPARADRGHQTGGALRQGGVSDPAAPASPGGEIRRLFNLRVDYFPAETHVMEFLQASDFADSSGMLLRML